ncbi:MAG: toll/interleukin-1 receptor domain-containing protein [Desulfobacteraceae bacterium]|nr:toll/interleukin-1 receptor domain-containing protein [Desulfobacteraceae bacterium]
MADRDLKTIIVKKRRRISFIIISLSIFFLAGFSFYDYFRENNRLMEDLSETTEIITKDLAKKLSQTLSKPVWFFDADRAVKSIESMMFYTRVLYAIVVLEADGRTVFCARERDENWKIIKSEGYISDEFVVTKEKIIYKENTIGVVIAYFTTKFIDEALKELIISMIIKALIITILFTTFFWLIVSLVREDNKTHLIERFIEFPPEYHQAGISVLNYFGTVLKKKLPGTKATIKIEQDGLKVKMIINPVDGGDKEIIEKTLDEYGLVIMGRMTPEEFTKGDKFAKLELKNELRIAYHRIESQRELLQITKEGYNQRIESLELSKESLEEQVGWLRNIVGKAIQSDHNVNISIGDKSEITPDGDMNHDKGNSTAGIKNKNQDAKTVKVFISCAEDDMLTANKIYADLQKEGILTPWVSHKDINAGEKTEFAVRRAIKNSDYFLALLSTSSVNEKGAFQKELKQAFDILAEHPQDGIFIVPVRLEDCNPVNEILNELHIIDLHKGGYNSGLERIIQAMRQK